MMSMPPLPRTNPSQLYDWRDSLYAVDMLTAALTWLDAFSWLELHPSDLRGICAGLGIQERPADVMLTLFTAMGLVAREGDVFSLTTVAREHLVSRSPFFLGPYYASFKERPVCRDLVGVLRTGWPANWAAARTGHDWAASMADPAFADQFTSAMDCRGVYLGQLAAQAVDLSLHHRLLDVGGGSGVYACAFAARHPHLRATVLDKPPVDGIARTAIAARGFDSRVDVIAGDMLEAPLPAGFDVHLISNVLHDWDIPTVRQLVGRSFEALAPGGLLIVHDAHLDADKSGPFAVAAYSVLLMHATEGRCYSVAEISAFLRDAGFRAPRHVRTAADRSVIIAERAG